MNPEHLELLVTREMPFGKYKGRLIADLPGDLELSPSWNIAPSTRIAVR